ncbi:MAG TPA: HDOD domain-containing protein, partial [Phycisphaerales bacterium]|nr:HDOD domain-containing protein [Phycisphaerales bacterium]
RLLKVVNSAFYGLPRQIGSINRAIVLLGLNAVKNIAIAASLNKLFRGGQLCPRFAARDLWIHSIGTAVGSKLICDELKMGLPDEAFLAGLIHDIGIMVEMQSMRDQLIKVFEEMKFNGDSIAESNFREIEQNITKVDHCMLGAGLCEQWKFPKSFAYVTGYHHNPEEAPLANRNLVWVVATADRLAAQSNLGFRADLMGYEIPEQALAELHLTSDQVKSMRDRLPKLYEEIEATFR